jgi:hypothetical protein
VAQGVTGRLEVRRVGRLFADMRLDIERGAKLTIHETDEHCSRLVRWEAFSTDRAECRSFPPGRV